MLKHYATIQHKIPCLIPPQNSRLPPNCSSVYGLLLLVNADAATAAAAAAAVIDAVLWHGVLLPSYTLLCHPVLSHPTGCQASAGCQRHSSSSLSMLLQRPQQRQLGSCYSSIPGAAPIPWHGTHTRKMDNKLHNISQQRRTACPGTGFKWHAATSTELFVISY
jgi:hypothetical protein